MSNENTLWEKGTKAMDVIKDMSDAGMSVSDMLIVLNIAAGIVKGQLPPVPRKRIKPVK